MLNSSHVCSPSPVGLLPHCNPVQACGEPHSREREVPPAVGAEQIVEQPLQLTFGHQLFQWRSSSSVRGMVVCLRSHITLWLAVNNGPRSALIRSPAREPMVVYAVHLMGTSATTVTVWACSSHPGPFIAFFASSYSGVPSRGFFLSRSLSSLLRHIARYPSSRALLFLANTDSPGGHRRNVIKVVRRNRYNEF